MLPVDNDGSKPTTNYGTSSEGSSSMNEGTCRHELERIQTRLDSKKKYIWSLCKIHVTQAHQKDTGVGYQDG